MKKHIESKFDECYISETLDNGLEVMIWHKPEMRTTSCVFGTPYGALDFDLTDENGVRYHHPSGIAHFLEHKMFEAEGDDVMNLFSQMGANVNAFTSYNETMYYFSTTSEEIEKPLNLLLDFVQELNITEESVQKEKGIITQELMMYMQMPDSRLYYEVFKALFHEHPYKFDIGGSPQSVDNTTFEQLQECYRLNYHPARMMLVCAGPIEPEIVLDMVRENQKKKEFGPSLKVSRTPIEEPETVAKESLLIPMEVSSSKVAVGVKLKPWVSTNQERIHDEWAIRCALEAHFSSLNPEYQSWIDQGIINNYFDYEVDLQNEVAFLLFINETDDREDFKKFVLSELEKCISKPIPFDVLNQLKKRYFGQAMRVLNDVEDIAVTAARNKITKVSLFDTLKILEELDQQQVKEAISHITTNHHCMVAIVPQNQTN